MLMLCLFRPEDISQLAYWGGQTPWFAWDCVIFKMASDTKNMGDPRQMEMGGNQHTAFRPILFCH